MDLYAWIADHAGNPGIVSITTHADGEAHHLPMVMASRAMAEAFRSKVEEKLNALGNASARLIRYSPGETLSQVGKS